MTLFNDIFSQDAFSFVSLQQAVNNLPYQETYLGSLGLFEANTEGLETDTAVIDETNGRLKVLSTRPRGTPPERMEKPPKHKSRAVVVPHIQFEDSIQAASLLGKRNPGENTLQSVARKINDNFQLMRQDVETTWEVHRLGALRGELLDADGSVIHDYFSLFGLTQQTVDFVFSNNSTIVRKTCTDAIRLIEAALGGVPYMGIEAICHKNFFDELIDHPSVRDTYLNWEAANQLRQDLRYAGFTFGGITWREYRGMDSLGNDIANVAAGEAIIFPTGVSGMYRRYFAPGDFLETVDQLGQPMYAKMAPDWKYNRWVDTLIETNPLYLNTRPNAVLRVTQS